MDWVYPAAGLVDKLPGQFGVEQAAEESLGVQVGEDEERQLAEEEEEER